MSLVEHGTASRYRKGCRCGECRAEQAAIQRARRQVRQGMEVPPSVPHGLKSTYTNWACRCAPCKEANRESIADLRARRRAQPIPEHVEHGRASTAQNWGCRCEPCRAANAAGTRRWHYAQKTQPKK